MFSTLLTIVFLYQKHSFVEYKEQHINGFNSIQNNESRNSKLIKLCRMLNLRETKLSLLLLIPYLNDLLHFLSKTSGSMFADNTKLSCEGLFSEKKRTQTEIVHAWLIGNKLTLNLNIKKIPENTKNLLTAKI